ncbi:MAG: transposase [Ignavibacteria bacterium]
MDTKQILENLANGFNYKYLIDLFRSKSRNFRVIDPLSEGSQLENFNDENFDDFKLIGEILLEDQEQISIVTTKVKKSLSEKSGKKAQYLIGKKFLKSFPKYSAGFFIFYDDKGDFRFSLIYNIPLSSGKLDWSNFRRYTYFVSKSQTNKTFIRQIDEADFSSLEKIIEAFSVEKVTKQFYQEIANWYFWAMDKVEFPDDEEKDRENRNAKNLIRLITRMIFIWFMKEKNLVPAALFEKSFVDKIINYRDKTGSTYYKAILQNLFFATLNTPMKKDDKKSRIFIEEAESKGYLNDGYLQQGYYRYSRFIKDKELFLAQFENVPFLNGGLFECLDKRVNGKEIRIDCFSNKPINETRLKVPDELFFLEQEKEVDLSKYLEKGKNKKVTGLLTILKRYNFTIDENTPIDQDVALDPELLGKVFENLLASYNPETATTARKATGSYYTPREIVDYMVNESLIAYLKKSIETLQNSQNQSNPILLDSENQSSNRILLDSENQSNRILPNSENHSNQIVPDLENQSNRILQDSKNISNISRTQEGSTTLDINNISRTEEGSTTLDINNFSRTQEGSTTLDINNISRTQEGSTTFYNPDKEVHLFYGKRGKLPHMHQGSVWYFVTFRLADALPKEKIEQLEKEREQWLKVHKKDKTELTEEEKQEYYKLFSERVEEWLNNGYGSCILKDEKIARIVADTLLHFNGERYDLDDWVIMPNHVHLLIRPRNDYTLSDILHSIKSYSAHRINKVLNRKESVWMHESYDHIVRNENSFLAIKNYIRSNPIKANVKLPDICCSWKIVNEELREDGVRSREDIDTLLRKLFDYSTDENPFDEETTLKLIDAIEKIKILDPACGSGAFPMGVLHKLVLALHKLDPENKIWKQRVLNRVPAEIRSETEQSLQNKSIDYIRKLGLIENCIYGVDIQEIAIQISKLRFFISLLVEQEIDDTKPNRDIRALPNLETKFVAANTLIELKRPKQFNAENTLTKIEQFEQSEQLKLISPEVEVLEKQLFNIREEIFYTNSRKEKLDLQRKEKELREKLKYELKKNGFSSDVAEKITNWDPFDQNTHAEWFDPEWMFGVRDGFDIVIGNPPYISTKDIDDKTKKIFKEQYGFADDTYNHFFFKGMELLKNDGILSYISSKTFWTIQTKRNLRNLLLNNKILILFDTANPFDAPMVDTCVAIIQKQKPLDNHIVKVLDGKKNLISPLNFSIEQNLYNNAPNEVLFIPNDHNKKIYERLGKKVNELLNQWWARISTSKNIDKFKWELEEYRNNLKPGDVTLLGLITEGGQGLATANNGKFVGVLENTKWADNVLKQRPEKLLLADKFCKKEGIKTKKDAQDFLSKLKEKEIRDLFDNLKEKYGRDIFGQGWLFRIVSEDEIADVNLLTEDEKLNGIMGNKTFVPYDKGDKDGNRWYAPTPYYIDWSRENVKFLKENSGKKGEGMPVVRNQQFYFREGFCWTDVNSTYLKSRLKDNGVYDVLTMSLFTTSRLPDWYFVCLINSKFISEYVDDFVNSTSHFQINDARQLPVIIPTSEQLNTFEKIFNNAYRTQKDKFDNKISYAEAEVQLSEIQKELDALVEEMYMGIK